MRTTKTLKPGQRGTKELVSRFGPSLLLVRVALRVGWRERNVQQRVKSAGGRWDPDRGVWILGRDAAKRLELLDRVVGGGGRG